MSVFKPSTTDIQPASLADTVSGYVEDTMPGSGSNRSVTKPDGGGQSSLSLALSLSKSVILT